MLRTSNVVTTQRTSKTIKLLQLVAHVTYCLGLVVGLLHSLRWGIAIIAFGLFLKLWGKFAAWWRHG